KGVGQKNGSQSMSVDLIQKSCQFDIDAPIGKHDHEVAGPQFSQIIGEKQARIRKAGSVQAETRELDDQIISYGAGGADTEYAHAPGIANAFNGLLKELGADGLTQALQGLDLDIKRHFKGR